MQNQYQKKYEQNKSRGRSNTTADSAFNTTLKETARFKINGRLVSQEDFFKLHINGFK